MEELNDDNRFFIFILITNAPKNKIQSYMQYQGSMHYEVFRTLFIRDTNKMYFKIKKRACLQLRIIMLLLYLFFSFVRISIFEFILKIFLIFKNNFILKIFLAIKVMDD